MVDSFLQMASFKERRLLLGDPDWKKMLVGTRRTRRRVKLFASGQDAKNKKIKKKKTFFGGERGEPLHVTLNRRSCRRKEKN